MLATILSWLTGGVLSEITSLWTSFLTAKTDAEKAAIMERIKTLQAVRDVQVTEAGNKITAWMRLAAATPFILMVWKYGPWDKIVCPAIGTNCATDDLSPHLWYLALVVYGFLFLHWTIGQWKA